MTDLLPCPFCGATTLELDCFGVTDDDQPTDWRVTHIDGVPCQAWGPECATRELAIAAWNRRAPSAAFAAGAEAMREWAAVVSRTWSYDAAAAIRALPLPEEPTP